MQVSSSVSNRYYTPYQTNKSVKHCAKDAGIENQAEDCKALFDFFATYTEKNEVKENTAIDFSRFAPNVPEEVKQAFMEAVKETGYNEGERMDYLSQVFIHQVENRQNGVANYTDVFGGSIASALQAAREILYDLENPLMPVSQRGENATKNVEQEKEFYRAFIEKLEGLTSSSVQNEKERNLIMSIENINSGNSYYVNPNTRALTSNIKNTQVYDKSALAAISKTLRPVDDMVQALRTPINLADETTVNRRTNSINFALGASVDVAGGFTLIVREKGVEAAGVTNLDNQEEGQEAQDMAGALGTLLRHVGGTMSDVGFSSAEKVKWTENVAKALDYFGIDTTKDFTVNGVKFTKDASGNFVSEITTEAMAAYEQLKTSNRTYKFADERTKKAIEHMSNYYLKTAPDSIIKAWQETLEETGINPFAEGYTGVLQQLSMEQDFRTGGNDNLLGETVESSIEAIEAILERIENPIGKAGSDDSGYLNEQQEFYSTLLSKIKDN